MFAQNLHVSDPTNDETELAYPSWMAITVIEDDDLMFGGKPLCAWYEEDRRRLSSSIDEEETRGRPRERDPVANHHQEKPHQHRHDSKQSTPTKE